MNLKANLTEKNQELLQGIGYKIENRDYSIEEIKRCESYVENYIMSFSTKNGDMAKETSKFSDLISVLVRNER